MTVLLTLIGFGLVLFVLRDVFHEIFHPTGVGTLSGALARTIWRLYRPLATRRPAALSLAGPTTFAAAIMAWLVLLTVGWALVYWPYMPEQFLFATGLDPEQQDGFLDAVYHSMVTMSTLGYGTITPTSEWLRMITPIETLLGFALLTAGLTWVLSIYPALVRRRSLAQEIAVIHEAEFKDGVDALETSPETAGQVLSDLASQLMAVRGDLLQFSITYYFHSADYKSGLSAMLPYLLDLAERGSADRAPEAVRLSSTVLRRALDDFASTLGTQFLNLSSTPTEEVLKAYARDHRRETLGGEKDDPDAAG